MCAASGHLCLKSSVELKKIRKHMKINFEVLVKTKCFNPGREGKKKKKSLGLVHLAKLILKIIRRLMYMWQGGRKYLK